MKNSKIEWTDDTWNPVTGCFYSCSYCNVREIVNKNSNYVSSGKAEMHVLNDRVIDKDGKVVAYPFGFEPTFHKYRLDEMSRKTRPRRVFVGSTTDLFGEWVPMEWIAEVLKSCAKNYGRKHKYFYLTKNPKRYEELGMNALVLDDCWWGTTIDTNKSFLERSKAFESLVDDTGKALNCFYSIEPIQERIKDFIPNVDWVIIGADSRKTSDKVIPKKEWVEEIIYKCDEKGVPVFMKDNLKGIYDENEIRKEFPNWSE